MQEVVFVHPYEGDRIVEILNEAQLQYAIKVLRSHGKVEVDLGLVLK